MKKTILTTLLFLVAMMGWAQKSERIWNNVVVGYTNVAWSEVTKVGMYADRTEVGLRHHRHLLARRGYGRLAHRLFPETRHL